MIDVRTEVTREKVISLKKRSFKQEDKYFEGGEGVTKFNAIFALRVKSFSEERRESSKINHFLKGILDMCDFIFQ